ncbi:MAG: PhoH family protein [Bacteroidales bacterium]|jgi:PhoH-like ATPase|nr:PhoH family protein [Bacteroidales bacterium]
MAKTNKLPKIFVLDTNVILHDYNCIHNFQDNDVVVPIVVLEEIDNFKKGNEQINYNARAFIRIIDELLGDKLFNGGISLGKGLGNLRIGLDQPFPEEMKLFNKDLPDHRILTVAYHEAQEHPDRYVALLSKDVSLRVKAKSLGIAAEDYLNDKVQNMESLDLKAGAVTVDVADDSVLNQFYTDGKISAKVLPNITPAANQFFVMKYGNSSAMARYEKNTDNLVRVEKQRCYNIEPRNSEQTFAMDALLNPNVQLVSLTGMAGTGKTLLAVAAALQQEANFDQILLARPVIPLQNQEIGFLPGEIKDKIGPYMLPLFDNISFIKSRCKPNSKELLKIDELLRTEKMNISPLAYIRGRSLSNTFFIIDEAQNLTPHEIKTIITRAGENTKIVLTGDIFQIDSPYLDQRSNGITYMTDKMHGQELFAHVNLVKGERSPLAELAGNIL